MTLKDIINKYPKSIKSVCRTSAISESPLPSFIITVDGESARDRFLSELFDFVRDSTDVDYTINIEYAKKEPEFPWS